MGYRVLLIKIDGKPAERIHQEYGVTLTEEDEEIPESPVTGASLPGGGYLLFINDQIQPDERVFEELSQKASLVACYVNETDNNSYACGWMSGVRQWSVFHDEARQGRNHLAIAGELPPEFEQIRANLAVQQERDVADFIFNIPVDLFVALGGIRYFEDIEGAGPRPWQVLARVP